MAWERDPGTSNQSDYLSHYVANHMFFRLALPGARRILVDHIEFCNRHVPQWNPMSVVGQHMQQAGATPAEAMAFTFATALQNADDCVARGMDARCRSCRASRSSSTSRCRSSRRSRASAPAAASGRGSRASATARRIRAAGASSSTRQTSGVDLTRAQPLNNIARVTVQAMAGILGGLQSLHTDAYDEALSCPTEFGARIAVATQNILREEAHLTDVIDPLGGSYYVETLTDEMEAEILRSMRLVEDAGGMYAAVEAGVVQRQIGESARRFQDERRVRRADGGRRQRYRTEEDRSARPALPKPDPRKMREHIAAFSAYKAARSQEAVGAAR